MPRGMDFPPRKKVSEEKEEIKLRDFSEFGKHVAGVSDDIEEPAGGGSDPAEQAPEAQEIPRGPAHARMQARERLAQSGVELPKKRSGKEGTLHLKENPILKQSDAIDTPFDSSDALARANQILEGIKSDINASGVGFSGVSKEWADATDRHNLILKAVEEYRSAKTDAERVRIEKRIKEHTARLANITEMNIRDAYQEKIASQPKRKGRISHEKGLPRDFDATLENYMKGEADAATRIAIQEKRARLDELEAQERSGGHKSQEREDEYLKIENELKKLEARLIGPQGEEPLTHNETNTKLRDLITNKASNYEGDANYPVPAVGLRDDQKQVVKYKNKPLSFSESENVDSRELVLGDAEKLQFRLRELALETRGEAGAKLFESRGTDKDTYLAQGATTLAMLEAEKEYLDAYGRHKKFQGMGVTIASKFIDTDKFLPGHLKDKKEAWMKARSEYLASTNQSLDARQDAREKQNAEHAEGRKGYDRDAVQKRYERRYGAGIVEAGVLGAEKAEQDTRINALDARSKESLEKLFDRYQKAPAYVRIPLTFGAITAVTAGTTALGGGALIGLSALGIAGTAAAASTALGTIAERSKNPTVKKAMVGLSFLLSPGALGKFLGENISRNIDGIFKTGEKANKILSKEHSMRDFADARKSEQTFEKRNEARNAHENVERRAAVGGAVGGTIAAATGGWGLGHWLRGIFGGNHIDTQGSADGHAAGPHIATLKEYAETGRASTGIAQDAIRMNDAGITTEGMDHMTVLGSHEAGHAAAAAPHASHAANHHTSATNASSRESVSTQPAEAPLTKEEINIIQKWEADHPEANGLPLHADQHAREVIAMIQKDGSADTFKGVHFEPVAHESAPAPAEQPDDVHVVTAPHDAPSSVVTPHAHDADLNHSHREANPSVETPPSEAPVEVAFSNAHGVLIDRMHPHVYADATGKFIISGGSYDEQVKLATDFIHKPENVGKEVLVMSSTPDPITGKPDVSSYSTDSSGVVNMIPVITDERNMPILPPTDNDLVRRIQ